MDMKGTWLQLKATSLLWILRKLVMLLVIAIQCNGASKRCLIRNETATIADNVKPIKIAEDVTPPAAAIKLMTLLSKVLPEAKLVPQKDLAELAFRDPIKRKMAYYNVIAYSGRARLKTAVELLKTTHEIEAQVEKVSSPLLVLHGAADKVTDPQVSKFLHEKASSKDKTLKLYPEGYHSILEGEPDDRILKVIDDIISWLDSRCDLPKP